MKIYLVRHGQTLFNVKQRIQGWCDSPLTEMGVNQAIALGKGLSDIDFICAYSSTSERAIDTANYIIGDREISLTSIKGLKEMNFGTLEGEIEEDVLAKDGSSHDKGFVEFGGETIAMTQKRVIDTLNDIAKKHPDGNVLVVSHGGAIMCALLGLSTYEVEHFRKEGNHIGNCSVSIIKYGETIELETIADTSFIEKGWEGE